MTEPTKPPSLTEDKINERVAQLHTIMSKVPVETIAFELVRRATAQGDIDVSQTSRLLQLLGMTACLYMDAAIAEREAAESDKPSIIHG